MRSYEDRLWQVTESPFQPCDLAHLETILTIGNGLVGVRGTFEEGYPGEQSSTLVAGIFNHKEGTLVPELVSMPNWLSLVIDVDGERFRLDEGRILGYERTLDMRTATLKRGVLWLSPNNVILRLAFERFASLDKPHVMALRVLIQSLSEGTHALSVTSVLDGTVLNPGDVDHWAELGGSVDDDVVCISGVTDQSGYVMAMHAGLDVDGPKDVQFEVGGTSRAPAHVARFRLESNQKATVTKLVTVYTSRDGDAPKDQSAVALDEARHKGYDALKQAHDRAWARYWDAVDVRIDGDEVAQRGVRFSTYHVLIAVPTHDETISVAAKTMSGFGYKGHVFWDTEMFIVPVLTLTYPELARSLLMYRYHNLQGARDKAAEAGYEGAMFPWESTDTGTETTPRWTDPHPITGERIRIWTGDNEQHISADIAYAVIQFWRWTGDNEWFVKYGAELVLDTARFWGSRAEYNAEANRYELRMQVGPDEYHENVDNSVFTNRLVVWHLEHALDVWDWLRQNHPNAAKQLETRLDITDDRLVHWRDVADRMWINVTPDGVLEQFEGFFEQLQPINLADYTPRTVNMDWILGEDGKQQTRVIKQADVVMLMALLGDEMGDADFLRRNWDTYYPVVDHGSSLSPAIHAWVGARLGLLADAYDMFIYAATIDLQDRKGNVRDGIHAASSGGVWQAVVFGFCGLHLTPNGPAVRPNLPDHWRRVSFNVMHQGQRIPFEITQ